MSAATSSIASAGEVWPPPSCSGPPATSGSSRPICPTSRCARARSATRRASARRWRASPTSSIAPGPPRPAGSPSFTRSTRPAPAMSSQPSTGKRARCSGWCTFRAWPPRDLPCAEKPAREEDAPQPVSEYGKSKLAGETGSEKPLPRRAMSFCGHRRLWPARRRIPAAVPGREDATCCRDRAEHRH